MILTNNEKMYLHCKGKDVYKRQHQGQHEGHGVICYLVHAVVRDVAYLYPHLGGRNAVDVIYPHTICLLYTSRCV